MTISNNFVSSLKAKFLVLSGTIFEEIRSFLSQGILNEVQSVSGIILGEITALAKTATNFPMHHLWLEVDS
jgi:hypothetical protein